jgi:hypothetical protein
MSLVAQWQFPTQFAMVCNKLLDGSWVGLIDLSECRTFLHHIVVSVPKSYLLCFTFPQTRMTVI